MAKKAKKIHSYKQNQKVKNKNLEVKCGSSSFL